MQNHKGHAKQTVALSPTVCVEKRPEMRRIGNWKFAVEKTVICLADSKGFSVTSPQLLNNLPFQSSSHTQVPQFVWLGE